MTKLASFAVAALVVLGLTTSATAVPKDSDGSSQTIQVEVPSNHAHTNDGTVLPPEVSPPGEGDGEGNGHGGGLLPATGGPAFWVLVAGLLTAAAGAGVVRRLRRSAG